MKEWNDAIHAFVLGPGLGRDKIMSLYINELLKNMSSQILVVDADGLWYLTSGACQNMSETIKSRAHLTILTPNIREFE